ncbi:hypothetical protein [Methanolacinia paynteri]|uniref:hypothetical protein n=1 Tax=Methanolacinia paynteri TaxID=230356 RepID=UPI00064F2E92|nr:hypothetical protein [Methanolacinia paynteri]
MRCKEVFERKNIIFISYISFFAFFCLIYYILSSKGSFYSGIAGIFLIISYPVGTFLYGYKTGDRFRAPLAGIVSYAFLILFAVSSISFQDSLNIDNIILFVGYHLVLLIGLGMIGFLASGKEKMYQAVAGLLSIAWILFFLSGIS